MSKIVQVLGNGIGIFNCKTEFPWQLHRNLGSRVCDTNGRNELDK